MQIQVAVALAPSFETALPLNVGNVLNATAQENVEKK